MNIDRPMATLFFEIKRNMPFSQRSDLKISAPDVGERLISIYRTSDNPSQKKRIEDFMTRAGSDWQKQLNSINRPSLLETLVGRPRH